jgi:glucose-1-phosphate thymidylyltransferase
VAEPALFGVVPAAGQGRRVAGLRWRKDLYPIGWESVVLDGVACRRPRVVASYLLDGMIAAGAERLFAIVGPGSEVMAHFGTARRGVPIAYLLQEELRGGAYAIDLARPWLPHQHTVLFGFPDTIVKPFDAFKRLVGAHNAESNDLTLGLFRTDRPSDFGMVRLVDGRPVAVVDKPRQTDLVWMYGIACWGPRLTALQPRVLSTPKPTGEVVPGDLFVAAIDAGLRVGAVRFEDGSYLDVGTASQLNVALERFGDAMAPADR